MCCSLLVNALSDDN